jgi:hypothetical protein
MPPKATSQGGTATKTAPAPTQLFRVGVYEQETNDYDEQKTMTTGEVQFPIYTLTPNGWLRGLWFLFEMTTASNSADVQYKADAPFSGIKKVTFKDVGNREVFGPITGYDWETIMKFGGYHDIGDPRADPTFSVTSGTGATGGSFSFIMYLPIEIVNRDALGDIENKSSSSSYKVELVMAPSTDVYSTSPTTLGTMRTRIVEDGYNEPEAVDMMGRPLAQAPPAAGSVQYWSTESDTLPAGLGKYLIQNGLGYSIRNIIFKYVDASGTRAGGDAAWPDPLTFSFGKVQLFQRFKKIWIAKMAKDFGLVNAATDASMGRELGVFPYWLTKDFGLKPGDELRNAYLNTKPGNVLQVQGTWGAAGTLYTTVNYITPPSNDPGRLRASR